LTPTHATKGVVKCEGMNGTPGFVVWREKQIPRSTSLRAGSAGMERRWGLGGRLRFGVVLNAGILRLRLKDDGEVR